MVFLDRSINYTQVQDSRILRLLSLLYDSKIIKGRASLVELLFSFFYFSSFLNVNVVLFFGKV